MRTPEQYVELYYKQEAPGSMTMDDMVRLAVQEAVEESCKQVCVGCYRDVPFVQSTLGTWTHAYTEGWAKCTASKIRDHFKKAGY